MLLVSLHGQDGSVTVEQEAAHRSQCVWEDAAPREGAWRIVLLFEGCFLRPGERRRVWESLMGDVHQVSFELSSGDRA